MSRSPDMPDGLVERYLDDELEPAERAGFERRLDRSPDLRAEIDRIRAVDRALRAAMAPPPREALRAIADRAIRAAAARPRRARRRLVALAAAASFAGLILGAWLLAAAGRGLGGGGYSALPWRSVETVYREETAAGFRPRWRCRTDEEFARTFEGRFGQGLLLAKLPDGVEALGLAYGHTLTSATVYLLARAHGRPVLVFVDRVERDVRPQLEAGCGLHLSRRVVGRLVLYELSPLERPALLEYFHDPGRAGEEAQPAPGG